MIIGLSGTQGTGKSTILQAAKAAGFIVDEISLSRTVQAKLGWDNLSRAQESAKNMILLQMGIAEEMFKRDMKYVTSDEIVLVERTPADVWAYTSIWCARNNVSLESNSWARDYNEALQVMMKFYACCIIVPQAQEIPFVMDPHRADLDSRDEVDRILRQFIHCTSTKQYEMKGVSREDRSKEICDFLKNYEN